MANTSSSNSLSARPRKLNIFSLPTNFKTKVGTSEILVKGQTISPTVSRYMIYIPKIDSETEFHVAVVTWDKAYETPNVRLHDVNIDPNNQSDKILNYMLNDKKGGIMNIIAKYEAWRTEQVNNVGVFENLADELSITDINSENTPQDNVNGDDMLAI